MLVFATAYAAYAYAYAGVCYCWLGQAGASRAAWPAMCPTPTTFSTIFVTVIIIIFFIIINRTELDHH